MANPEMLTDPEAIKAALDHLPVYEVAKFSDEDWAIAQPLLQYNGMLWNDEFMDFYEGLIDKYGKDYVDDTRLRHILGGSGPHPELLKYKLDTDTNDFQNFIKYMDAKLQREAA